VRTRKESERARVTHQLESAERQTSEDRERKRTSEGHSRPGERRATDKRGHEKKSKRAKGTHVLESADRWISEDAEREGARGGTHVLESAERRTSEDTNGKRASERGVLTSWIAQIDGQVRTRKASERGALTVWIAQIDGQVRTRKASEGVRGTHELDSADRRTSEDTERKQTSEGHSRPGERRSSDK
jgi:hypothetical protein